MDKDIQAIVSMAARFPGMRFGQFLTTVVKDQLNLYYTTNNDLKELCILYCAQAQRVDK